ncbi:alpha/beta fold hydrolase [Frondihabitans sp. PhB188]|uniref:alpha/beta fold hydrolase n=1 Tax=Frondihabitans sp. PhB188 TaxID=2485200 RepID=UPI001F30D9C6|nr:alpha/beta fold hydrolase [Frondihabitans sp. PhB188]
MTYPPIEPFAHGHLAMDDGAELYWEASGNREGVPALWLHGGPGGSLGRGGYRRHFDPERYLVVGIDQRGSGRSRPWATEDPEFLRAITTERMIADIEAVREELGFDSWVVSGVSWGTTLALAYALAHPAAVRALALVAVTTTSRDEVDWITEGVGRVFPEAWDDFEAASERRPGERLVDAYARRLRDGDPADRERAASAWDAWESVHVSLDRPELRGAGHVDPAQRLVFSALVTHFWSNDGFLPGSAAILGRVGELAGIPAALVHGRRDISGPASTAWRLHRAWAGSALTIVEDEAHGGEREMAALAAALDGFAGRRRARPAVSAGSLRSGGGFVPIRRA